MQNYKFKKTETRFYKPEILTIPAKFNIKSDIIYIPYAYIKLYRSYNGFRSYKSSVPIKSSVLIMLPSL